MSPNGAVLKALPPIYISGSMETENRPTLGVKMVLSPQKWSQLAPDVCGPQETDTGCDLYIT